MASVYRGSTAKFTVKKPENASGDLLVTMAQGDEEYSVDNVSIGEEAVTIFLSNSDTARFNTVHPIRLSLIWEGLTKTYEIDVLENHWEGQYSEAAQEDIEYEDDMFELVIPDDLDNPEEFKWYVKDDTGFTLTDDPVVEPGTEYYAFIGDAIVPEEGAPDVVNESIEDDTVQYTEVDADDIASGYSPAGESWYESTDSGEYIESEDIEIVSGKQYYYLVPMDDGEIYLDEFDEMAMEHPYDDEDVFENVQDEPISEESEDEDADDSGWEQAIYSEDDLEFVLVTPEGSEIPSEEAWFENVDGDYEPTVDDEVVAGKSYYAIQIRTDDTEEV